MTLVVAGHSLQKGVFGNESDYIDGLFATSDSSITSGNKILVSGFKKVVEIPIRVKALNFCGTWFNGYHGHRYEGGCFVAFAGSTLVAQHIMNSIRNHLGDLYPTYEDGEYKIVMSCEGKKHLEQVDYDESMFLDSHLNPLLTAEYISEVVNHSIQSVLDKAKNHNGMKDNFTAFQAEFILGIRCPNNNEYYLYQYEILSDNNGGAIVKKIEIPKSKVAVIGLRDLHADDANAYFNNAVKKGNNTEDEMHRFVAQAIDSQNKIGVFSIGKPCVLYKYDGKHLVKRSVIN